MSHAPEPWEAYSRFDGERGWIILNNDGGICADLDEADARRIVACVNACKGSTTADLNHYAALGGIDKIMGVIDRDRAELLAALKDARVMVADWGTYADADIAKLDAAIEKAES